jgi:hypothetical protein
MISIKMTEDNGYEIVLTDLSIVEGSIELESNIFLTRIENSLEITNVTFQIVELEAHNEISRIEPMSENRGKIFSKCLKKIENEPLTVLIHFIDCPERTTET